MRQDLDMKAKYRLRAFDSWRRGLVLYGVEWRRRSATGMWLQLLVAGLLLALAVTAAIDQTPARRTLPPQTEHPLRTTSR